MKPELETEALPRMSSVLGANAIVVGNAIGQGDLDVRGRVQGDVILKGRALVSEGGVVLGRVEALSVTVAGQVRGDIIALEEIHIHPTGDVEGNISAPRVSILAGARVLGSLRAGDTSPRAVPPALRSPDAFTSDARRRAEDTSEWSARETSPVQPPEAAPSSDGLVRDGFQPSQAAPLPLPLQSAKGGPRGQGKPKRIPSFQKGSRAELKDAE